MQEVLEQVTISDLKGKIKEYVQDPNIEIVVTRRGKPIGVFMGVSAWRTMQDTLNLFKNSPESFLRSLMAHRRFQETGEVEGISLSDFELLLKQGKLKD